MKIAIIATNYHKIPPEKEIYAPLSITERLADGLVERGHDVTLFASSDSTSRAKTVGHLPELSENQKWGDIFNFFTKKTDDSQFGEKAVKYKEVLRGNYELLLASEVLKRADQFDIIQTHSTARIVQMVAQSKTPVATTFHNPLSYPMESNLTKVIYEEISKRNKNIYFISLSDSQRKDSTLPFVQTVYNGIDTEKFSFSKGERDYLLFVGRMIPRKGVDVAVRVAQKTGKKLVLAGPIYPTRKKYWEEKIKPHLGKDIVYKGVLSQDDLVALYKNAEALLMPILGEESFGLVMTEAMSCGVPVVGYEKSSLPEVVEDGKTGFLVNSEKELVESIKKIQAIDPLECRKRVERKFSTSAMVDGYEEAYKKIIKKNA